MQLGFNKPFTLYKTIGLKCTDVGNILAVVEHFIGDQ
jgi:hypothetical protein